MSSHSISQRFYDTYNFVSTDVDSPESLGSSTITINVNFNNVANIRTINTSSYAESDPLPSYDWTGVCLAYNLSEIPSNAYNINITSTAYCRNINGTGQVCDYFDSFLRRNDPASRPGQVFLANVVQNGQLPSSHAWQTKTRSVSGLSRDQIQNYFCHIIEIYQRGSIGATRKVNIAYAYLNITYELPDPVPETKNIYASNASRSIAQSDLIYASSAGQALSEVKIIYYSNAGRSLSVVYEKG